MTHTTEQERVDCPACNGKPQLRTTSDVDGMRWHHIECNECGLRTRGKWVAHYSDECSMYFQEVWSEWPKQQAAHRAPAVPVPQGVLEAAQRAHDWMDSQADSQSKGNFHSFDLLCLRQERDALAEALAAAPQPPEAAPVQLPEPAGVVVTTIGNYASVNAAPFVRKGEKFYTEQQVMDLLKSVGVSVKEE